MIKVLHDFTGTLVHSATWIPDLDWAAKLIPTFEVGCRRLSPDDNYLEALLENNVAVEFDPIQEVRTSGIRSTRVK